jgi:maleate cis-trans isomerase
MRMKRGTPQQLHNLARNVAAEATLLADAHVDVIGFACTAGSFMGGVTCDPDIMTRIEQATGVPAATTAGAVVEALREMKVAKLALLTPYLPQINRAEIEFLEEHGLEVLVERGLGLDEPLKQAEVSSWRWYRMAREMAREASGLGATGLLISCGGIHVADVIEEIEQDTGMTVVTSNQALLWKCLRIVGVNSGVRRYGRLLQ